MDTLEVLHCRCSMMLLVQVVGELRAGCKSVR